MKKLLLGFIKASTNLQGITYMILACFCFSMINIIFRQLSHSLNPYYITCIRSFFCVIIMSSIVLSLYFKQRITAFKFNQVNLYKGIIDFLGTPCWVYAISHMNVAEAVAISLLTPIISVMLAMAFLKERPSKHKIIAVVIGFIGAVIIINPAVREFNIYTFAVIIACTLWAAGNVLTKGLTNRQPPVIIILFSHIITASLAFPFALLEFRALAFNEATLLLLLSLFMAAAHFSLATACSKAQISLLMPFDYTRLIFTAIFFFMFFNQGIGINTVVGSLIIVAGTSYLYRFYK